MGKSAKQLPLIEEESLPDLIRAPRTDPTYNAHGYLTKVPVQAIIPFIERFTDSGEIVCDLFAGSGMTGIAALMTGRSAKLSDISVLGQHLFRGYVTGVKPEILRRTADDLIAVVRGAEGQLFKTKRVSDGTLVEVIRTVWSFVYRCPHCSGEINYYEAIKANKWQTPKSCPSCLASVSKRELEYLRDEPVVTVVDDERGRQVEQEVQSIELEAIKKAKKSALLKQMPSRDIEEDREMFRRSALAKWGLENTGKFFSPRNAVMLTSLWLKINDVSDAALRQKLLFAFTAVLARASKRYQWSPMRPLNAANQNYYIAPVFYEWNILDLFNRKVDAIIRSDEEIRAQKLSRIETKGEEKLSYDLCSAHKLKHLKDESVDYVFTDPPFGSNIFYSDMNLFHEAWLGKATDPTHEAVVHTNGPRSSNSGERYLDLLSSACREAFRVLKPGRYFSIIFGNSSGKMWSIFQEAISSAGFEPAPVHIATLDKGQRSVKGLNSGTEEVATLDLIITLRKPSNGKPAKNSKQDELHPDELIRAALQSVSFKTHNTPSHLYLAVLKGAMGSGRSLANLHLSDVLVNLRKLGYRVNPKTGKIEKES